MISVVIPARDAAAHLRRCLQALPSGVEVVVVDDGSADATPDVAREHGAIVVRGAGEGPAAARNLGVQAATGTLLAFTDADCVPGASWLRAVRRAFEAGADVVRGPVRPLGDRPPGRFDRTLWVDEASPRFETANLAIRRRTFEAVGGFRRLPGGPQDGHFGEDVLLGWAAVRLGARVRWAPEALVRHAVHPRGARAYVAERERLRFFGPLVREVPELRRSFVARTFLSPETARFDAAAAGLALAALTRSPLPALAAVPYARRRPDRARVAADAVGLAALVRGSVAARRVVL